MLPAQSPMQDSNSQNCEIMTWAETKSQMLNQMSHPGAPIFYLFITQPPSPPTTLLHIETILLHIETKCRTYKKLLLIIVTLKSFIQ